MKISLGYALAAMLIAAMGVAFGLFFAIELWGYVPTLEGKLEWGMFIILYLGLVLGMPALAFEAVVATVQDGLDDARTKRRQRFHSWTLEVRECEACHNRNWGYCYDHEPADWL